MRKLTALIFAAILALQGVLAAPAFADEHESGESTTVATQTPADDAGDGNVEDTAHDDDPVVSITGVLRFVDVETGVFVVDDEVYLIDDPETLEGLAEGDFVRFDAVADSDGNLTASAVVAVEPASDEEPPDGQSDEPDDDGDDDSDDVDDAANSGRNPNSRGTRALTMLLDCFESAPAQASNGLLRAISRLAVRLEVDVDLPEFDPDDLHDNRGRGRNADPDFGRPGHSDRSGHGNGTEGRDGSDSGGGHDELDEGDGDSTEGHGQRGGHGRSDR